MKKWWQAAIVALLVSPGIAGAQSSSNGPDAWQFELTPFLWGAGLDGTVGVAGREAEFDVSTKDLLKALDFAFMVNFEARRHRWSVDTDVVYVGLGKDVTVDSASGVTPQQNPRLDMGMTIVDATLGYQVAPSFDILAGVRGVDATASLVNDQGTLADVDGGFVDPIVGGQFRRSLSKKLWVNLRGDVGGFGVGSDFEWFLSAEAGIRLSRLISLDFGYRVWSFDYKSDDDFRKLDATMAGFGGGLTFHF
jgi:hypothetical protein